MEPILTKEEIAELLTAIKSGEISPEGYEELPTQGGYRPKLATGLDIIQTYSQAAIHGLRIPNLDIVLDDFSRNIGISITNLLQRAFSANRVDSANIKFRECISELDNEGPIGIYSLDPLKHGCLIHFDNQLSFMMLEIMLGSSAISESQPIKRNLTMIERNVFRNIMDSCCLDIKRAFTPVIDLTASLVKVESNHRLVSIVEDDTEVIVTRFKVAITGRSAEIRLIVPLEAIEPLREQFKEITSVASRTHNWSKLIVNDILGMSAMVVARSGLIDTTIGKVLRFKPGDFLEIDYDPDQPLTILVEDKPKFFAQPGKRNLKKAINITGRIRNLEGVSHGHI